MATIEVRQGRTRTWTATVKDANNAALTNTYTNAATLTLSLWPVGDTNATTLTTSAAAWTDPTNAAYAVTLTQADTTNASAGVYEANVTITTSGSVYDAHAGLVVVKPSRSRSGWLVQPLEVAASWSGFASLDEAEQVQLIEAATDAIEETCRRTFALTTYTETYDGEGLSRLWLRQRPVVAVSSVVMNGTTLTAGTDYHVDAAHGCLVRGESGGGSYRHRVGWFPGSQNITVVYQAGFAVVPAAIKRAAIVQAKFLSDTSRASSVYSFESIGDYQYKRAEIGSSSGVSPDVASLLRGYVLTDL